MPSQHQQFHNTNKTNLEHPKSTQNKTKQPTQHKSFSNTTTHPLNQPTTYKPTPDQQHPKSNISHPTIPIKSQQQPSETVPIVAEQSVTANLIPWVSGSNPIPSNIFPTSDFFSNNISHTLIKTSTKKRHLNTFPVKTALSHAHPAKPNKPI
jgi:hypothetical protein